MRRQGLAQGLWMWGVTCYGRSGIGQPAGVIPGNLRFKRGRLYSKDRLVVRAIMA